MSKTIDFIVAELSRKDFAIMDFSARFVIQDEGSVVMDATGVRESDESADVTLSASLQTFHALFEGRLNPATAFMTGKLKVDGAMGKAMGLARVLG